MALNNDNNNSLTSFDVEIKALKISTLNVRGLKNNLKTKCCLANT